MATTRRRYTAETKLGPSTRRPAQAAAAEVIGGHGDRLDALLRKADAVHTGTTAQAGNAAEYWALT